MTDPLDIPLSELSEDIARRNAIIEQVQVQQGVSYPKALEAWEGAVAELRGAGTVRTALRELGLDATPVDRRLKYLEQSDVKVAATYKQAKAKQLDTDPFGRVLLSQSYKKKPKSLDADNRITDPMEFEKRLVRARKLDSSFAGDAGRALFKAQDEASLSGGVDVLRTWELAAKEQAATAKAGQVRRELEAAYAARVEHDAKVKLLDDEQSDLDARRRQLEQPPAASLRLLDGGLSGERPKKGKTLEEKFAARVDERARRLGLARHDRIVALEQEHAGLPMPPDPSAGAPAPAPSGVHPGSHQLHRRVHDRIKMLDRHPERDYIRTMEEVLAEDEGRKLLDSPNIKHGPLVPIDWDRS